MPGVDEASYFPTMISQPLQFWLILKICHITYLLSQQLIKQYIQVKVVFATGFKTTLDTTTSISLHLSLLTHKNPLSLPNILRVLQVLGILV
jgi:hypothetical protein